MKAYKCYGINGYKESIYFTPRHGDAAPDEIEIYLQPYCNEAETFDGKKTKEKEGGEEDGKKTKTTRRKSTRSI